FGGKVRQAALKTGDETAAERILARFEATLDEVLRGRLIVPPDADLGVFLLSDGKLDRKPVPVETPPAFTVADMFRVYQTQLTAGAKEANTRKCEGIHMRHLERLLGRKVSVAGVTTAVVQNYVDRRAREKYR